MFKKILTCLLCLSIMFSVVGCVPNNSGDPTPEKTPITYTYTEGDVELTENVIADSYLGVDARGTKIKFLKENVSVTINNTFKIPNKDSSLYSFVATPLLSSFSNMEADIGKITFRITDVKSGNYLTIEHEGDGHWWTDNNGGLGGDEDMYECSRVGVAGNGQKIGGTKRNAVSNLDLAVYHPLASPFTGSKFSVININYNPRNNVMSAEPAGYYFSSVLRDFSYAYPEDPVTWPGFTTDSELKLTITFNRFAHKDERDYLEASLILISTFGEELYQEV